MESDKRTLDGTREVELKFGVDPNREAALKAALRRAGATCSAIESCYFDTPTRRLAKSELSLRLRRTAEGWEQTFKSPGRDAVERFEDTVPLAAAWEASCPTIDPGLHVAAPGWDMLDGLLRQGEPLERVFMSRVHRLAVSVGRDDAEVEVVLDTGSIDIEGASTPICEVEYEVKRGNDELLFELARQGIVEHGMWLSGLTKSARGQLLATGLHFAPAEKSSAPVLTREMSGPELHRAILAACLRQVVANAGGLAAGHRDDASVHQLRVGLRRLRTVVRDLSALDREFPTGWDAVMAETFRTLGVYRDGASVLGALRDLLAAAGSPEPRIVPRQTALPDPVAAVRDPTFQLALLDVLAATRSCREREADGPTPGRAGRRIDGRLSKLHRQLTDDAQEFMRRTTAEQHDVRKRIKRLRYLSEMTVALYGRKTVRRYVDAWRPVQDAMGDYVDTLTGLALARTAPSADLPGGSFNVGYLTARLPVLAARCAACLADAVRERPFW